MKKRQFLCTTRGLVLGALSLPFARVQAEPVSPSAQIVLTITGDILRVNRGKLDKVKDQLMHKHGVEFERAFTFCMADIEKLPAISISPTMEYDAQVHRFTGPLLSDVLAVVGVSKDEKTQIKLRGIDGYSPELSIEQIKKWNVMLATEIDEKPMSIGGFGPLFALYDADRIDEFASKPLDQRFALCPWGVYCIEVVS